MWDYKVIAGTYALDGADVVVENPLGRGTLQRILDHYGAEGFELVSAHYDQLNREIVVMMKKLKAGAAMPMMGAAAPMAQPAFAEPEPEEAPRGRRGGAAAAAPARGGGGRRRLSKDDLDRLYRE